MCNLPELKPLLGYHVTIAIQTISRHIARMHLIILADDIFECGDLFTADYARDKSHIIGIVHVDEEHLGA